MSTRKRGILPREGFTADVILALLGKTVMNPALLLPLALLARFTNQGEKMRILHPTAWWRLRAVLAVALTRSVSSWYSNKVVNNWATDKWNWNGGEIAVVTGGAGGIGSAMVKLLAERGVRVAVLDINEMDFDGGDNVAYFKCDITSSAQIAAVAEAIRERWGDPTILINNAGLAAGKTILDGTENETRLAFEVNTLSMFRMTREFLPSMVKRDHGMVVTISSAAALHTVPNLVDYAGTKAAAMSFHEGLGSELVTRYKAPRVRTVLVIMGLIKTKLATTSQNPYPFLTPWVEPQTAAERIVGQILTGRSGNVVLPTFTETLWSMRAGPYWRGHQERINGGVIMDEYPGRLKTHQVITDVDKFFADKEAAIGGSTVLVSGKKENDEK